jgi:hypothetical protein
VLRVSCSPARAQVGKVTKFYASIGWPWREIDPDSRYRWNGEVAFPTPASHDDARWIYPTDPEPQDLVEGQTCLVSIPETLVRIVDVIRHDPPQDVGWLPRPRLSLVVVGIDEPEGASGEDEYLIRLDSGEPITINIVSRS